jgi:hypothetical protein
MPMKPIKDLTPEEAQECQKAHAAFVRADVLEAAILELEGTEHRADLREEWAEYAIPVLRAEHEKAYAEHLRLMRELGYEGA